MSSLLCGSAVFSYQALERRPAVYIGLCNISKKFTTQKRSGRCVKHNLAIDTALLKI
jgi:hypothetical protein